MKAECRDLGRTDYKICWDYQQFLFDKLLGRKGSADDAAGYLLLTEHNPVYTLGKSGKAQNLLVGRERLEALGAQFFHIDRGGDITFHGPGQLVVYPVLDLEKIRIGLKDYIAALEEAVIRTVALHGVAAGRIAGASGVWIGGESENSDKDRDGDNSNSGSGSNSNSNEGDRPRKICAIGVRASRYVTMHGLAFNVSTDLGWFDHINPCGFTDRGVTSLERETGHAVPMEEVKASIVEFLSDELNVKIYNN